MYYLRTKPAANAIQFTVDKKKLMQRRESSTSQSSTSQSPATAKKQKEEQDVRQAEENMAAMVCSLANKDDCLMCGS